MAAEPYAYASSNPTNLTDPSGLCVGGFWCPDVGDVACALGPVVKLACETAAWIAEKLPACSFDEVTSGHGRAVSCQIAVFCAVPQNTAECIRADEIRVYATGRAYDVFPCEPQCEQGTIGRRGGDLFYPTDAFRHCFGSGMMALEFGAGLAKKLTTMYEEYEGNDSFQKAFDLFNNQRGREFAELIRGGPDAESQLEQLCRKE